MAVVGGLPLPAVFTTDLKLPRVFDCQDILSFSRGVVRTVVERNLQDAAAVLELYAPFEYLLSEEGRLATRLSAVPAPTLVQCEELISQVLCCLLHGAPSVWCPPPLPPLLFPHLVFTWCRVWLAPCAPDCSTKELRRTLSNTPPRIFPWTSSWLPARR
jgi:hypothetical protein